MSEKVFRLNLKSTYDESERIPDFVMDIQNECHLGDEFTGNLMLVLSEAVTNAIIHGNKLNPEKMVAVSISVSPESVTAVVQDEGDGFKPLAQDNPLESENLLKSGGRGVFLIRELSDRVEYQDSGSKLIFTLSRT